MIKFNLLRRKKYLFRIFVFIYLSILLVIAFFSGILYVNISNSAQETIYESNRNLLEQMRYNIDYVDEIVKNMALSAFHNPDVKSLMYSKHTDDDLFNIVRNIEKVRSNLLVINPQIHSLYIYNNTDGLYYGTYSGFLHQDTTLVEMIENMDVIPLRKPIYRKFQTIYDDESRKYEDVITYIMYQEIDEDGNMDGAVIINIKPQWILDNIEKINNLTRDSREEVFVITKENFIMSNQNKSLKDYPEVLDDSVLDSFRNLNSENFRMEETELNKTDVFVSYLYLEDIDWIILKIQPFGEVFRLLSTIRTSILILTVVFVISSLIISLSISRKLYSPIQKLMKLTEPISTKSEEEFKGEFDWIENALKNIGKADMERIANKDNYSVLKDNFLRQLILDSTSFNTDEIKEAFEQDYITFDMTGNFSAGVVKIDNFDQFEETFPCKDGQLMRFAIKNILCEVLSEEVSVQMTDINTDEMVFICNSSKTNLSTLHSMRKLLYNSIMHIQKYLNFSVTISVSEFTNRITEISNCYRQARDFSNYRFILGKAAVIFSDNVMKNEMSQELFFPSQLEENLGRSIKSCDFGFFEETLSKVFYEISGQNYSNCIISVVRLISIIRKNIIELCNAQIMPIDENFTKEIKDAAEFETVDEVYFKLLSNVEKVFKKIENPVVDKYSYIVKTVKEIIQSEYMNPGLCLQELASNLKMSPNYLGKIFKESSGKAIPSFINDTRMEIAAKWLLTSNLSVKEIMKKVGIENEAIFYRHFKSKYGTTPKDFCMKNITSND